MERELHEIMSDITDGAFMARLDGAMQNELMVPLATTMTYAAEAFQAGMDYAVSNFISINDGSDS